MSLANWKECVTRYNKCLDVCDLKIIEKLKSDTNMTGGCPAIYLKFKEFV